MPQTIEVHVFTIFEKHFFFFFFFFFYLYKLILIPNVEAVIIFFSNRY